MTGPVAEDNGGSGAGRMPQRLPHDRRQAIDPAPQIHRRPDQPRHRSSSASHRGDIEADSSSRWPWP